MTYVVLIVVQTKMSKIKNRTKWFHKPNRKEHSNSLFINLLLIFSEKEYFIHYMSFFCKKIWIWMVKWISICFILYFYYTILYNNFCISIRRYFWKIGWNIKKKSLKNQIFLFFFFLFHGWFFQSGKIRIMPVIWI